LQAGPGVIVKKAVAKHGARTKKRGRRSTSPIGKESLPRKPSKVKSRRPHGVTLADLFLWITIVDECQYHPRGAFERAAVTEGLKSGGNVQQRLSVLESRFGKFFKRPFPKKQDSQEEQSAERKGSVKKDRKKEAPPPPRRYRSGVPTDRGAALAEIFATIEHLYHYALSLRGVQSESDNVIKVKNAIFRLVPSRIQREFDREVFENGQRRNRITRTQAWSYRLRKRRRASEPKRLSDLRRMRLRYPNDPKYNRLLRAAFPYPRFRRRVRNLQHPRRSIVRLAADKTS
jgi:hypothetical protein